MLNVLVPMWIFGIVPGSIHPELKNLMEKKTEDTNRV